MNSAIENEKPLSLPLIIGTIAVALVLAIVSSMASVRNIFNSNTEKRKILSKVFTEYDKKHFVIFKIQTTNGIDLEIYEKESGESNQAFKQRFNLNNDSEAYLMVNSNAMNLGLIDVNKDGQLDIVAPTADKNGNSRLNVFQYNKDLSQFTPFTEGEQQ